MLPASISDDKGCILKGFKACFVKYYVQYYDLTLYIIYAYFFFVHDIKLIARHLYWAVLIE
jgi:hypothetical protein